jgi:hypothetical protein
MSLAVAQTPEQLAELVAERYPFLTEPVTFNTDVDICYYGCSFTAGIGLEDRKDRWTDLVDNELGYTSNNFGIEGIGVTEILNLFSITSKFVKMKRAVFLLPAEGRMTAAIYNHPTLRFRNLFSRYEELLADDPEAQEIARTWFQMPRSVMLDRVYTDVGLIQRIADLLGIQAVFATWNDIVDQVLPKEYNKAPMFKNDQLGTDGLHPGSAAHAAFAQGVVPLVS